MRFYLLTNDEDTLTGMRLAGIEGEIITDADALNIRLDELLNDGNIGIILINMSLLSLCGECVSSFRKSHTVPLIIEIPDKNSQTQSSAISDYVREAIGIKI